MMVSVWDIEIDPFSAELYDPEKNLSMYFIYVIYRVTLTAVESIYCT